MAIFVLFVALLATIGGALMYFGILERIQVSTGASPFQFANAEVAYKLGKGKPADSGALFTEVCSIVPGKTTFGAFLELEEPDPENPLAERKTRARAFSPRFDPSNDECHYMVGVITATEDNNNRQQQQQQIITEADRQLLKEKGFRFTRLPASENVVYSTFPFRGIVSVVVGIRRVYPALLQYISEHRLCAYPAMEFYNHDTIYYILPLSQQDQFLALFETEPSTEEPEVGAEGDEDTEIDEEAAEEEEDSSSNTTSSFEELWVDDGSFLPSLLLFVHFLGL